MKVIMHTNMGDVTLLLYADTPLHRKNFVKLASEGYYDGLLFHRVIKDFMIQGGDPDSRDADINRPLGSGSPGYQIDAEIRVPEHFHKRGALAAARTGDAVNPLRRSSGSQFYIVTGRRFTPAQLNAYAGEGAFTPEQLEAYSTVGGAPHLDGAYTVFGEVIDGMDVIDKIQHIPVNGANRPLEDARIISMEVIPQ